MFSAVIIFCLISSINTFTVESKEKQLYKVIPTTKSHIRLLQKGALSTKGLSLWNGIGDVGDPVEILTSSEIFSQFNKEVLIPAGMRYVIVYPKVLIKFSTEETPIHHTNIPASTSQENTTGPQEDAECPTPSFSLGSDETPKISKINGTSLYTEIYYKWNLKTFTLGVISPTEKTNYFPTDGTMNYLQLDLDPNNLPHYEYKGKWYDRSLWKFQEPTGLIKSVSSDWYAVKKKEMADVFLARSYLAVPSGVHITLPRKLNGGEWKGLYLWKLEFQNGEFYKLRNNKFPHGTFTWTAKKYGKVSYFMQQDTMGMHVKDFVKGGKWYDHSLFSFTPDRFQVDGRITSVTFSTSSSDANAIVKLNERVIELSNTLDEPIERKISENFEITSGHQLKFLTDFSSFNTICVNSELFMGSVGDPYYVGSAINIKTEVMPRVIRSKSFMVTKNVLIGPKTSVNVTAHVKSEGEKCVPFKAVLVITGRTRDGRRLPGIFIKEHLHSSFTNYTLLDVSISNVRVQIEGVMTGYLGDEGVIDVSLESTL